MDLVLKIAVPLLALLVLIVFLARVGTRIRNNLRRASAANNVVAAAATFATLNNESRQRVAERAVTIIKNSGWHGNKDPTFPTDVARWGWYALAMNELGIRPVCLTSHWGMVRNPFMALLTTDSMLDRAMRLAEKAGYRVQISRAPGVFEMLSAGNRNGA